MVSRRVNMCLSCVWLFVGRGTGCTKHEFRLNIGIGIRHTISALVVCIEASHLTMGEPE